MGFRGDFLAQLPGERFTALWPSEFSARRWSLTCLVTCSHRLIVFSDPIPTLSESRESIRPCEGGPPCSFRAWIGRPSWCKDSLITPSSDYTHYTLHNTCHHLPSTLCDLFSFSGLSASTSIRENHPSALSTTQSQKWRRRRTHWHKGRWWST